MERRKGGMSVDKWECIAENLQKARKKCGYSYQKLADKTGLSKSTLQRYESGAIRSLPLEKAEQLAQALNITPAELLGWQDLNQYKELGDLDRLRELVQADREGRAHILPSPRENTCGKCGNFTRTPGCGYGECTLRPGLRPYQSRAKCKRYTEKALE